MPYANFIKRHDGEIEVKMSENQPCQRQQTRGMLGYIEINLDTLDLKDYLKKAFCMGLRMEGGSKKR